MRVNIDALIEILNKWKEDGTEDIDLVALCNLAYELAAGGGA